MAARSIKPPAGVTEPPAGPPLAAARRRLTRGQPKTVARHPNTAPATLAAAKARPVALTLRFRHTITSAPRCKRTLNKDGKYRYVAIEGTGGMQSYGPGAVRVPPDVAQVLNEMERNAMATIAAETTERAVIIGPQGGGGINKLIDVPPELFGEYLGWARPIGIFR